MPRAHPAAPPRLGSAPLWGTAREQSWLAAPRPPERPSAARRAQSLAAPGAEFGRSAPQVPALPGPPHPSPSTSPNPERAGAAAGEVQPRVREAAVAREPLQPLPALAMGPGPQLLLPLALCVGLGLLVTSAGASGVSRRGPTVTAKVTDWRAADCPRAGQGDGGALGTGSSVSAAARRGLPGRRGREVAAGLSARARGPRCPGRLAGARPSSLNLVRRDLPWELREASGTTGLFLQEGGGPSTSFSVARTRE